MFDLVQGMAKFYDRDNVLKGKVPLVQIHVISITNLQILQAQASFGLGEVLSPIRAMLSARESRALVALSRMWRFIEICGTYSECGNASTAAHSPSTYSISTCRSAGFLLHRLERWSSFTAVLLAGRARALAATSTNRKNSAG